MTTSFPPELKVGGLAPLSSCDWPGQLAATVFCQGCAWRCRYCHNAHLLPPDAPRLHSWPAVTAFLLQRRRLLDGVVFSGGEPTLQRGLPAAIGVVRDMGFRVGLHTAGPYPDRLSDILPLVDWIGFDAKAPFSAYEQVTGVPGSGDRARESLRQVIASGKPYEVRTTLHPLLLDVPGLESLAAELAELGVENYAVQRFRSTGCRDAVLNASDIPLSLPLPAGLHEQFKLFELR